MTPRMSQLMLEDYTLCPICESVLADIDDRVVCLKCDIGNKKSEDKE